MSDALDILRKAIAEKPVTYAKNPHWVMHNNQIMKVDEDYADKYGSGFTAFTLMPILDVILPFFRQNYDSFKSESQVLLVTHDDYLKMKDDGIPQLKGFNQLQITAHCQHFHILVLPQVNTWGNTSVSELYWQNNIVKRNITPIMRIHTHHILNAYQSNTDWSTLNSGTLEVVIGKIYDAVPEIAYWLDVRGTNNKEIVFKTTDYGVTVERIDSGHHRQLLMNRKANELVFGSIKPGISGKSVEQ